MCSILLCDIFSVSSPLNKKKHENNITSKWVEMAKISMENLRITVTYYHELRIKTQNPNCEVQTGHLQTLNGFLY